MTQDQKVDFQLEREAFTQDCVPGNAEYAILTPKDAGGSLPLMLLLHGGESDREFLAKMQPLISASWQNGDLPACAVVTPSAEASFYMDYRDGSQSWETLVARRLPEHVAERRKYIDLDRIVICGVSMGGSGGLRMAFKSPQRFKAVAALEPGIEEAFDFDHIPLRNRFWRDDASFEGVFGKPVDRAYWAANNIANLARSQVEHLKSSGLQIYFEAGTADSMLLQHGAEFLHRLLWDLDVAHEYRSVLGADHIGSSLPERFSAAFRFLTRALKPPAQEPETAMFHAWITAMKQRSGLQA